MRMSEAALAFLLVLFHDFRNTSFDKYLVKTYTCQNKNCFEHWHRKNMLTRKNYNSEILKEKLKYNKIAFGYNKTKLSLSIIMRMSEAALAFLLVLFHDFRNTSFDKYLVKTYTCQNKNCFEHWHRKNMLTRKNYNSEILKEKLKYNKIAFGYNKTKLSLSIIMRMSEAALAFLLVLFHDFRNTSFDKYLVKTYTCQNKNCFEHWHRKNMLTRKNYNSEILKEKLKCQILIPQNFVLFRDVSADVGKLRTPQLIQRPKQHIEKG